MSTLIFVTPLLDTESPVRGYAAAHVRALTSKFERVVVLAGIARGDSFGLGAEVIPVDRSDPGHSPLRIGPALAGVVAEAGDSAVVVVDDDLPSLVQASAVARARRLPLLWWCPQIPSSSAATEAARWADGLLVAAAPETQTPGCRIWSVGAGIDLSDAVPPPSALPSQPPLRLVALGRTSPRKGLPVILRAVAIARSQGIDTRLAIIGPSTNATEWRHRQELDALVKSVALTEVVRITDAVTPTSVPEVLHQAHVLIDAGTGDDMSLSVLEAMAAGRAVLSSSAAVARLIAMVSPAPLSFEQGDAAELAERIGGLSKMWPTNLWRTGAALRLAVEKGHSLDQWLDRFEAAIHEIQGSTGAPDANTRGVDP